MATRKASDIELDLRIFNLHYKVSGFQAIRELKLFLDEHAVCLNDLSSNGGVDPPPSYLETNEAWQTPRSTGIMGAASTTTPEYANQVPQEEHGLSDPETTEETICPPQQPTG